MEKLGCDVKRKKSCPLVSLSEFSNSSVYVNNGTCEEFNKLVGDTITSRHTIKYHWLGPVIYVILKLLCGVIMRTVMYISMGKQLHVKAKIKQKNK